MVVEARVGMKTGTILWFCVGWPWPGDTMEWWSNMKSLKLFSLMQVKALEHQSQLNSKALTELRYFFVHF